MKKKIKIMAAILCFTFLMAGCAEAKKGVNITVAKVKTESSISDTSFSGSLEADDSTDIFTNIAGKVVRDNFEVGDSVKKGDILFTLDDTNARLQLRQASLSGSSAYLTPLQVAYDEAKKNFERLKVLYASGNVSKVEYEAAEVKVKTTAAQLQTARESSQISQDMADKTLKDTVITAPVSGVIASKDIDLGVMASPQMPAMTIIDQSKLKIIIQVTEKTIVQVYPDMPATVSLQATGETFEGKVSTISPVGNVKTGMFDVTVVADNKEGLLKAGMLVNVTLQDPKTPASFLVPKEAIVTDNGQSYVFVLNDGKLQKTAVETGKDRNAYMEILEGLTENDVVVVQGSQEITEKSSFNVVSNIN